MHFGVKLGGVAAGAVAYVWSALYGVAHAGMEYQVHDDVLLNRMTTALEEERLVAVGYIRERFWRMTPVALVFDDKGALRVTTSREIATFRVRPGRDRILKFRIVSKVRGKVIADAIARGIPSRQDTDKFVGTASPLRDLGVLRPNDNLEFSSSATLFRMHIDTNTTHVSSTWTDHGQLCDKVFALFRNHRGRRRRRCPKKDIFDFGPLRDLT